VTGMIWITVKFRAAEAKALHEACRRFQFPDAQHLLRYNHNIKPDDLCEAILCLREAIEAAGDSQ
jgi:hypothetical protein